MCLAILGLPRAIAKNKPSSKCACLTILGLPVHEHLHAQRAVEHMLRAQDGLRNVDQRGSEPVERGWRCSAA
eukprot:scaffold7695_cov124-Isochrysis_galbana.AAC.13